MADNEKNKGHATLNFYHLVLNFHISQVQGTINPSNVIKTIKHQNHLIKLRSFLLHFGKKACLKVTSCLEVILIEYMNTRIQIQLTRISFPGDWDINTAMKNNKTVKNNQKNQQILKK